MRTVSITEIGFVMEALMRDPKPSPRVQAAIEKCQEMLCLAIEDMRSSSEIEAMLKRVKDR
jgi:hypothetical protein